MGARVGRVSEAPAHFSPEFCCGAPDTASVKARRSKAPTLASPEYTRSQDGGSCAASLGAQASFSPNSASLGMLVECLEPLLYEVVSLLDKPREMISLSVASRGLNGSLQLPADSLWNSLFQRRWPAFHDCLAYQGARDWRDLYKETLLGHCECTLEVFDREKKLGFAMAAMAARIQYEARTDVYIARYLSASEILPETIPVKEEHRLRFCPLSARSQLQPCSLAPCAGSADARVENPVEALKVAVASVNYPYQVLTGVEGLQVGQGVELQWKMQYGSPFGWWYGHLEALHKEAEDGVYRAVITFQHFPSTSRWYRLEVKFGDTNMRPCSFGGYTGGIRATIEAERARWMMFFPKAPVVF